AFFIPYCLFLALCGLPLFFMEVSYGQFSSLSPLAIWRICPLFKGVGIGMVMVSSIVCIYYNVIIAWTIYYLFMSFRATLPWSHCKNSWNSENCIDTSERLAAEMAGGNSTSLETNGHTVNVSTIVGNTTGAVVNAVYETVTGVAETAAKSNKSMSASEEFWERHVLQLSSGIDDMGELRWQLVITLALSWIFVFLCLFKGVKILGKGCHDLSSRDLSSSPSLASWLMRLAAPSTRLLLRFGMFETMLSGLIDEFPHHLRNKKTLVTACTCLFEFLFGLPSICQGGIYVLQIMDWYCASFSLMLISLFECLAIAWIYGVDRFMKDIALMIGYEPHRIWIVMWKFVTPAAILFIWLFSVITLGPVTYGDYNYPKWAIAMGWSIGVCSMLPIPLYAIFKIATEKGPIVQRVRKLLKPTEEWGPRNPEDRKRYLASLGHADLETVETLTSKPSPIYKPSAPEQFNLISNPEKSDL
ncbi:hypothetical protein BaRGS_00036082, partial [Batillaria attramentaria]